MLHHHLPGQLPGQRLSIVRSNTPGQDCLLQSGTVISDVVLPSATELMEAWNRCADLRQAVKEPKHPRDRPRTRTTLSERLRTIPPAEPVRSSAGARAPAWSSALALVLFSIGRTFRASHSPLTSRSGPLHLFMLVVRLSAGAAGAQTLLAAFARRRADCAGRGDALAHARRRRAAHAWVTLAAAPQPRHIAPRLSSPRPLLSSRRRSLSSSRVFSSVAAPC